MSMTPEQSAVSLAAEEADVRTTEAAHHAAGIWHGHFLDALREAGYVLTRTESSLPHQHSYDLDKPQRDGLLNGKPAYRVPCKVCGALSVRTTG